MFFLRHGVQWHAQTDSLTQTTEFTVSEPEQSTGMQKSRCEKSGVCGPSTATCGVMNHTYSWSYPNASSC